MADDASIAESKTFLSLFSHLITFWPTTFRDELIHQAWLEHQRVYGDPKALDAQQVSDRRERLLQALEGRFPTIHVDWKDDKFTLVQPSAPLPLTTNLPSPLLVIVHNDSHEDLNLSVVPHIPSILSAVMPQLPPQRIRAGSDGVLLTAIEHKDSERRDTLSLRFQRQTETQANEVLAIPVRLSNAAMIRGTVKEKGIPVPARITVEGSDAVYRYDATYGEKKTLTDKPIIYPPIGIWQKTSHFYCDGSFELAVPTGATKVIVERGFETKRQVIELTAIENEVHDLEINCDALFELEQHGWVPGDTHVHWVTNQWNVDEPLELLALVQRAEGVRVANNLTLLQRYADQAFIKPSQAPMGVIRQYSDLEYHMQMGEEYRNEDLYGHLCFLNIDWLVQPIGTGAIIAGPDALDYPLNRTAIEACRSQGGISIEAHGTGGNKDVPINVVHRLTDSIDQLEPSMYYKLLDCGFQIPLTNGSDHPARTLGIARAFVKVDGDFGYQRWIDGIRRGRTFTSSGPLLFISVNSADVGDVLTATPEDKLVINAHAISRDPIGRLQIVSNGEVIAEKETEQNEVQLRVEIAAAESRWVVARCSNRHDGREEFGFGDFNVITGPGVAHTSPIYVEVDRQPRINPAAIAYWQQQIALHQRDVQTKGRFANSQQLQEAIDYLTAGSNMYAHLAKNAVGARSPDETFPGQRRRIGHLLRRFSADSQVLAAVAQVETATTKETVDGTLAPFTLLQVSTESQSDTSTKLVLPKLDLVQHRPQRFFVRIDNPGGTTAELRLRLKSNSAKPADSTAAAFIEVIDSPLTSRYLTGAREEYKVVEITPHFPGQYEIAISVSLGDDQQMENEATVVIPLTVDAKPIRTENR